MSNLTYTTAPGKDISRIISRIEPLLLTENSNHVVIAMLVLALSIQSGESLAAEELAEGVKGVSEWMSIYLDSLTPTGTIN